MTTERTDSDVAERLLPYLRAELARPDLSYAEPPSRVSGGNETYIYAFRLSNPPAELSGPLILRAYRQGYVRPQQARFEAAVQNAVAALGYPAARVSVTCEENDPLGTPFIVMERMPGALVLEGIGGPDASGRMRFQGLGRLLRSAGLLYEIPRMCAEAQLRLHALDPQPLLDSIERAGLPRESVALGGRLNTLRTHIDANGLDGLREALAWLLERAPEPQRLVICHCDIQPNNILLTGKEITGVVDWSQVIIADSALDVGYTKLAFETVPLDMPGALQWLARPIARGITRRYMAGIAKQGALDRSAVPYYEVLRALFVLAFVGAKRRGAPSEPDAFDSPAGIRNLIARIRTVTNIEVRMPEDTRAPRS